MLYIVSALSFQDELYFFHVWFNASEKNILNQATSPTPKHTE